MFDIEQEISECELLEYGTITIKLDILIEEGYSFIYGNEPCLYTSEKQELIHCDMAEVYTGPGDYTLNERRMIERNMIKQQQQRQENVFTFDRSEWLN